MNIQNKNRIIFSVLIFLVIVNLSALITFFTFGRNSEEKTCDAMQPQCGMAFKSELGLTNEQLRKVDMINLDYSKASSPFVTEIRKIRSDILDELSSPEPDTISIRRKSVELGDLQLKLQYANFNQFLELKKVCDPEQAQKLSALYRELYGCARAGNGEGRMGRHR